MNNDQQITPEEFEAHRKKWEAIAGSIHGIRSEQIAEPNEDKYGALKFYIGQRLKWVAVGVGIGLFCGWLF